ncbi:MAG: stage V sporulation protein AC [Ruminococcaceae bacterium]|nr:stage V sporulation protein AC [Oscillospiraceae bacterium]
MGKNKDNDKAYESAKKAYRKYADKRAKKSDVLKNCCCAFFVGGMICVIGEVLKNLYVRIGIEETEAASLVSVSLIFLSILLTGLDLYKKIAKHAGAGTLVPITGFANAMAAPAIDSKSEGFILGVGAKIFSISGPVILYGISASVIYGIIYWVTNII